MRRQSLQPAGPTRWPMQRQPQQIYTQPRTALIRAQVLILAQVLISTQVLCLRAALAAARISFQMSLWPLRRTMRMI